MGSWALSADDWEGDRPPPATVLKQYLGRFLRLRIVAAACGDGAAPRSLLAQPSSWPSTDDLSQYRANHPIRLLMPRSRDIPSVDDRCQRAGRAGGALAIGYRQCMIDLLE